MLKIVTVLKRPDLNIYNGQDRALYPEHVYKIRDMCKQHISLDYDFFCFASKQLACITQQKLQQKKKDSVVKKQTGCKTKK